MEIVVSLLEGQQLKADFKGKSVISDQSIEVGGKEEYPEPFEYFLASLSLCSAFYMRKFCEKRGISTNGLKISQRNERMGDDHYKKKIIVNVTVPDDFPQKYRKALIASANTCTVKKVIQAIPEFEIAIVES